MAYSCRNPSIYGLEGWGRDLGNLSGGREKPETRTIEGPARRATGTAPPGRLSRTEGRLCAFDGERDSMREPAMTAVTPGACLNGLDTRPCRDALSPEDARGAHPRQWRREGSARQRSRQLRTWPKEQQPSGAAVSAAQSITSSGPSGPGPMTRTARQRPHPTACKAVSLIRCRVHSPDGWRQDV